MKDSYDRRIDYLRISLTDRCNLRCTYCMPEAGIKCLPKSELLSDEEILILVQHFAKLGIKKIKITGGEPLVRPHICSLIKQIKDISGIEEVTMTTNAVLLADYVEELEAAGLDGLNISLDTLRRDRFEALTRRDEFLRVVAGIEQSLNSQIKQIKINTVIIKEINGEEIFDLVELARHSRLSIRFIELMPIGLGKKSTPMTQDEVLECLEKRYGKMEASTMKLGNGPAIYYDIEGFRGHIGFISAMSHSFCFSCNRVRLSCDGYLKTCLHFKSGLHLKPYVYDENLDQLLEGAIYKKQKEHHFKENILEEEIEQRSMVQIGG